VAAVTAALVETIESLPADAVDAVLALVEEAAATDGFSGLNEAASLRLRHPHPGTVHLLIRRADKVVGYGQLHLSEGAAVVHPQDRHQGLGTALLQAMIDESDGRLQIWATRNTAAARALAERSRLVPVRQLLIMKRPLTELLPPAEVPDGVRIRAFRPGQDEEAWLRVNARAFADHPEQGGLTREDLDERMSEPWFDADGFLLALRQAQGSPDQPLLGFHWTKQHPGRIGEVYVLGVDPEAGVPGLGRALLAAGLAHLRSRGNTTVQLYADAENVRAVELYSRAGFVVASSDVMYAGPDTEAPPLTTMQSSSDA
jgi:mycothiol synthase